ncbi:MAG: M50 family metallopeptidase [Anaerolineae bacterium]|nr:M50 family metallopeptidase [Anaerolineae bacterium]
MIRGSSHSASQRRELALAAAAFVVALVLWQVQELYLLMVPFRLFVTMIHELAHGLAAELTGGDFLRFEVTSRGAGLAYTRGGSPFVIIQAGYLGTALFGAGLLLLTYRTQRPGRVAVGVGVFLAILTLAYAGLRPAQLSPLEIGLLAIVLVAAATLVLTSETDQGRWAGAGVAVAGGLLFVWFAGEGRVLGVFVGLASALLLIALGLRARRDAVLVVLTFLAFLTGLQAISDAWVLLRIVTLPGSLLPFNDASAMSDEFGGPAAAWAFLWIVADALIMGAAAYVTFVRPRRQQAAGT